MAHCWDKTTLLLNYTHAVKAYTDEITALHELMPGLSKTEYDRLYRIAEGMRLTAEEARSEMERHIRGHGC